jgi:prepilin-type N-terminal cleavage/methylation domain-containing protein
MTRGFSYMEMIIALGLFSILLMTALPLLNQAGRNLAFAQDGYTHHLSAQNLMHYLRESPAPVATAATYAAQLNIETYSITIWNIHTITINSPCAPDISVTLHGLPTFCLTQNTSVISVLIWNEHGGISGRAIGSVKKCDER